MRRSIIVTAILLTCVSAGAQSNVQEPEQISMLAFLMMIGFVLLAVTIVFSIVAKLLVGYGLVPAEGKLRKIMLRLAGVVSDVRVVDGEPNSRRTGSKGTRL